MSTGCVSRRQKPGDAVRHLIVVDKFAPVGLCNAIVYADHKSGLAFEHVGNCVLDQLLGILANCLRHLLKPRLHIGCEMYFHALRLSQNGQRSKLCSCCGRKSASTAAPATFEHLISCDHRIGLIVNHPDKAAKIGQLPSRA